MLSTDNVVLLLLNALLVAITAWVYSEPLTEYRQIFNKPYILLERLPKFIFYPLIGCAKCVAGQWALLYYLIACKHITLHGLKFTKYNPIHHCLFIGVTICLVLVVHKLLKAKDEE